MFDIGQRVVCVDDCIHPVVKALYLEVPVKGHHYIVRDWRIGVEPDGRTGSISILLEGLENPKGNAGKGYERGFNSDRFGICVCEVIQERGDEVVK